MTGSTSTYTYSNLTKAVTETASPLRAYLKDRFPSTLPVRRRFAEAAGPLAVPSEGANAGTIGTAFDLQTKLMLDRAHVPAVAFQAFANVPSAMDSLAQVLESAKSSSSDEELAQACWAMALTTEVYRSGRPSEALINLGDFEGWSSGALLGLAPPAAISELCKLAELARKCLLPEVSPHDRHMGPTFDGSYLCKADADLIADGTLLELKTRLGTKKIEGYADALQLNDLYQVVAYALFDFSDIYGLNRVGFYSGRYGHLETYDLGRLLEELAGGPVSLATERSLVRGLLGGL